VKVEGEGELCGVTVPNPHFQPFARQTRAQLHLLEYGSQDCWALGTVAGSMWYALRCSPLNSAAQKDTIAA